MNCVLDTNIISNILKGDENLKRKVQRAVVEGQEIFINAISYFEIKRGFLAINATAKLDQFNQLCEAFGLLLLDSKEIFDGAAEIWAYLEKKGQRIQDADILIASVAKMRNLIVVSGNEKHFKRIPHLKIENWQV